jgi:Sensors of blue-light using FAD
MNLETNAIPKNARLPRKSQDGAACVQLVYISRAVGNATEVELPEILRQARGYNSTHGITGILCFAYGRYLQVLEGGTQEVNELYLKIGADKRHEAIRLMKFSHTQSRAFALWSMRLIRFDENSSAEARSLVRFNSFGTFEPEHWTGDECLEFLRTLARVVPVNE